MWKSPYAVPQAPLAPDPAGRWQANLDLRFERRAERTVLAGRRHDGPLRVQKALYPEGPAICHVIVLHPPAGIVGGDALTIGLEVAERAHACITTPGAAKWYRSSGPLASQQVSVGLGEGSVLEWLPQEAIFFDGARARTRLQLVMHASARFFGWDLICLGRRASAETFITGSIDMETRIDTEDGPLWLEKGLLAGADPMLSSAVGLAERSVCATLLVVGLVPEPSLLAACRAASVDEAGALAGLTCLPGPPGLLVGRYLGHSAQAARAWMFALWRLLRPALVQREASAPRIWST
jgi:urease accessory protein